MCPTDIVAYFYIGHCFTMHKSLTLSLTNTGIYGLPGFRCISSDLQISGVISDPGGCNREIIKDG